MSLSPINMKIVDTAIRDLGKVTEDGTVTRAEYDQVSEVSGQINQLIRSTEGDEREHAIEVSRSLNLACSTVTRFFEVQADGTGMVAVERDGILDVKRAIAELELTKNDPAAAVTADISPHDTSFDADSIVKARPVISGGAEG